MKKIVYLFLTLILVFPVSSYALEDEVGTKKETVTLEACVDGDTARFRTKSDDVIKTRFLAVDTPETVHPKKEVEPFGKEASEYTCTTLTNAKEIVLEYDNDSDEEDLYGRKLVWVFTDGVLLQESLVSKGYAEVAYLYGDYKYTSLLQDTQEIAKNSKLGIWSDEVTSTDTSKSTDTEESSSDEEKNFIEKIFDGLLGAVSDFIGDLLESLLNAIEDML